MKKQTEHIEISVKLFVIYSTHCAADHVFCNYKLLKKMTLPDNSLFCCYCGEKFNPLNRARYKTADHLIPLSKGGVNNPYNKRNCCNFCNTQKSDLLLQDFLKLVEEKNMNDYNKNIKIENIKYLIDYVNSAREKVFKHQTRFVWYERRYLKAE